METIYYMHSGQSMQTSKDQQIRFVGGPESWKINQRWQTTEYLASGSLPVPARPLKPCAHFIDEQNLKFN